MINFKLIAKILGTLLFLEAMFMAVCLIVSLCYQEGDMVPLAVTVGATLLAALVLWLLGRGATNALRGGCATKSAPRRGGLAKRG